MINYPGQDTLALLSKTAIFRDLDLAQLQQILSSAHRIEVERRSFLYHQGEPADFFYVLLEGNARLSQITPEGRQVIMHTFGPGDVMAIIVALANAEYPGSAEATTNCVFLSWDRGEAIRLMERYPRLAVNGMEMVAGRFWELQNRYRELATERVERRVAHTILRLIDQGIGLDRIQPPPSISLSRQDLAEMTGTTLFTVSRLCSKWEQSGIVEAGREQITLLQAEQLAAIADDLPLSSN